MKAKKKKDDTDLLAKVVTIGDSGVGKTNILMRFYQDQFCINYCATVGIDFKVKVVNVHNKKVKLQIWDTGGQQRYKNINQTYYRGSAGIVLVYSTTQVQSFLSVENWIKQIHQHANSNVVKFLVANKIDLKQQRQVSFEQGKILAQKFGMPFFEVSAKDGTGINELFNTLGEQIYLQSKPQQAKEQRISLTSQLHQQSKRKSCKC